MLVAPPDSAIPPPDTTSPTTAYVFAGPQWYRIRIRRLAPLLALLVPALMGAVAITIRAVSDSSFAGWARLIIGVAAAPGLLVVGVPFASTSSYPAGIAISVALWLAVGYVAGRTATRNPVAAFTDFWRAYSWLAAGVWLGSVAAIIASSLLLGRQLI